MQNARREADEREARREREYMMLQDVSLRENITSEVHLFTGIRYNRSVGSISAPILTLLLHTSLFTYCETRSLAKTFAFSSYYLIVVYLIVIFLCFSLGCHF